jgi:hypothetical protein
MHAQPMKLGKWTCTPGIKENSKIQKSKPILYYKLYYQREHVVLGASLYRYIANFSPAMRIQAIISKLLSVTYKPLEISSWLLCRGEHDITFESMSSLLIYLCMNGAVGAFLVALILLVDGSSTRQDKCGGVYCSFLCTVSGIFCCTVMARLNLIERMVQYPWCWSNVIAL